MLFFFINVRYQMKELRPLKPLLENPKVSLKQKEYTVNINKIKRQSISIHIIDFSVERKNTEESALSRIGYYLK